MKAQGAPQKLRFTIQAVSGEVRTCIYCYLLCFTRIREHLPGSGFPNPFRIHVTRRTQTTQFANFYFTAHRQEDGTPPGKSPPCNGDGGRVRILLAFAGSLTGHV